jgi:hypothetical protein
VKPRSRSCASARGEEPIEPFEIVRTSRNELIVMGSDIVAD